MSNLQPIPEEHHDEQLASILDEARTRVLPVLALEETVERCDRGAAP
jgi:hypothetical protein